MRWSFVFLCFGALVYGQEATQANRTVTNLAIESRRKVYQFLANYLHPANPAK
jgi:hypothetical protein